MLSNVIAVIVLVLVVGGAIVYIVKSKKKGVKCIGCPYAGGCTSNSCGSHTPESKK